MVDGPGDLDLVELEVRGSVVEEGTSFPGTTQSVIRGSGLQCAGRSRKTPKGVGEHLKLRRRWIATFPTPPRRWTSRYLMPTEGNIIHDHGAGGGGWTGRVERGIVKVGEEEIEIVGGWPGEDEKLGGEGGREMFRKLLMRGQAGDKHSGPLLQGGGFSDTGTRCNGGRLLAKARVDSSVQRSSRRRCTCGQGRGVGGTRRSSNGGYGRSSTSGRRTLTGCCNACRGGLELVMPGGQT